MIDSQEGLPEASGRSFMWLMESLYHTSSSRAMPEPPATAKTHGKTVRHHWIWSSRTSVADGKTEAHFSTCRVPCFTSQQGQEELHCWGSTLVPLLRLLPAFVFNLRLYSLILMPHLVHSLLKMKVLVVHSYLTLCSPTDLPGSSVRGILQARNTGVDSESLFQGIFSTWGWNPGLLHCRQILYHLSHQGSAHYCQCTNSSTWDWVCQSLSGPWATEGGMCFFRGSDQAGVLWKPGAQMTAPPRDCVSEQTQANVIPKRRSSSSFFISLILTSLPPTWWWGVSPERWCSLPKRLPPHSGDQR